LGSGDSCKRREWRRIRDVRAADLKTNCASAASTSPSGELCAGGDGGKTPFGSARSDEDGGNPSEHRGERQALKISPE
jgi:hypothetical protein